MEYVETSKDKQKIVFSGYYYVKVKKLASGADAWECEKRRGTGTGAQSSQCKARLNVKDDAIVKEIGEHSHAPDGTHKDVLIAKTAIKRHAQSSQDTAKHIITSTMQGLSQEAASAIASHSKYSTRNTTRTSIKRTSNAGGSLFYRNS